MWKLPKKLWLAIGALAAITGGGLALLRGGNPLVTDENYHEIVRGLTQDEVEAILGPATLVRTGHKAVWKSMSAFPKIQADDNPDLYECRIYMGRIDKRWHQSTIRVAFRKGEGVIKAELFEDYCPMPPQ